MKATRRRQSRRWQGWMAGWPCSSGCACVMRARGWLTGRLPGWIGLLCVPACWLRTQAPDDVPGAAAALWHQQQAALLIKHRQRAKGRQRALALHSCMHAATQASMQAVRASSPAVAAGRRAAAAAASGSAPHACTPGRRRRAASPAAATARPRCSWAAHTGRHPCERGAGRRQALRHA